MFRTFGDTGSDKSLPQELLMTDFAERPLNGSLFLAKDTATLTVFSTAKGGAHGSQRSQEMRTPGMYVSGRFGEVLQTAVRDDGRNPGRGLQVPSLSLQG
jgi:hypothetical protein